MLIIIHEPRAGIGQLAQGRQKIVPPKPILKSNVNATRTEHFPRTALALIPPPYSSSKPRPPLMLPL